MKLEKKKLFLITLIYIYVSILIFLFGFTKLWIALICSLVAVYSIYKIYFDISTQKNGNEKIQMKILVIIIALIFFMVLGYYIGWGRWVKQVGDYEKHNAVLADLVEKSWPVYYNNGSRSMLTYYIAQYLFPALIGKLFHSYRVAEIVQYIWSVTGLMLVYLNLTTVCKLEKLSSQLVAAVILPFFSIPLPLSQYVQTLMYPELGGYVGNAMWQICQNGILVQYSSNLVLLEWVFPQVITPWLSILIFMDQKEEIQNYVVYALPLVLYATLSFVGFIPFLAGYAFYKLMRDKKPAKWVKQIFSLQNVSLLLTLGMVFILYFYGNVLGDKPNDVGFARIQYGSYIGIYFIFVIVNVLLYAALLWKKNCKDFIFKVMLLLLIVIPFFKMGVWNDFVMRCSIPVLFILLTYIIRFINDFIEKVLPTVKRGRVIPPAVFSLIGIMILLGIGVYYPAREVYNNIVLDDRSALGCLSDENSLEYYANRDLEDITNDLKYNYYTYDVDTNLFYQYVARTKE